METLHLLDSGSVTGISLVRLAGVKATHAAHRAYRWHVDVLDALLGIDLCVDSGRSFCSLGCGILLARA